MQGVGQGRLSAMDMAVAGEEEEAMEVRDRDTSSNNLIKIFYLIIRPLKKYSTLFKKYSSVCLYFSLSAYNVLREYVI